MPESTVQLFVWMRHLEDQEESRVVELLEEFEFYISTTWEPAQGELEYQTTAFADTEENVTQIRELESSLREQFSEADVSFSGLDKSRQTTRNRPISGAYRITIETALN